MQESFALREEINSQRSVPVAGCQDGRNAQTTQNIGPDQATINVNGPTTRKYSQNTF